MRILSELKPKFLASTVVLAVLGCLMLVSGCARPGRRPPPLFYEAPLVDMSQLDASCLEGRRIVLDPGHGGTFRGARGWGGLDEADVNLGVALYLWGLLKDAGAQVFLTRSSDKDFLSATETSLRDDLSRRMQVAEALQPDLFISLHHNADMSRSPDKNQIETYFRMLDEGPSRDVALLIHRHLIENLSITQGEVVPGNYFVLRNAPCPAVLGEPSYLTNPWVEEKLKLAEKQRLEAQAYFLGIVEYFGRGTPRVTSLSVCDTVVVESRPTLSATISIAGTGIDTCSVGCELDGIAIPVSINMKDTLLVAAPQEPLVSGLHKFCFFFRNLEGNSSGESCCYFEVALPPAFLSVQVSPGGLPQDGGVLVIARLADANGNAVKDDTSVWFSSRHGFFSQDSVGTVSGVASSIFFPAPSVAEGLIRVRCENLRDSLNIETSPVRTCALKIVAARSGEPLESTKLWHNDSLISTSTPQGLVVLTVDSADKLILTRKGFVPTSFFSNTRVSSSRSGSIETLEMKAAALGLIRHKRIVVDVGGAVFDTGRPGPEGQPSPGAETGMVGVDFPAYRAAVQGGHEGPHVLVAAHLARMLAGAGAEVLILDRTIPDTEKVKRSERFSAHKYLRVELSPEKSPLLLHYPGSPGGIRMAQESSRWWSRVLSRRKPLTREDAHYVLRQTSCPALILRLPVPRKEQHANSAAAVAYALHLAVVEVFGLRGEELSELEVMTGKLRQNEKAIGLLDEYVSLPITKDGTVSFFCEEGEHSVRILSDRGRGKLEFVTLRKGSRTRIELPLE